jgi:HEAT repeat protein
MRAGWGETTRDPGEHDGGELFEQLLRDRSLTVRISAALALGRIGAPSGAAVLLECLAHDEPPKLRDAAEHALGQINSRHATTWEAS